MHPADVVGMAGDHTRAVGGDNPAELGHRQTVSMLGLQPGCAAGRDGRSGYRLHSAPEAGGSRLRTTTPAGMGGTLLAHGGTAALPCNAQPVVTGWMATRLSRRTGRRLSASAAPPSQAESFHRTGSTAILLPRLPARPGSRSSGYPTGHAPACQVAPRGE